MAIRIRACATDSYFTVSRRFPPAGFGNRANILNTRFGKVLREARIFSLKFRANILNTRFGKAPREARIFSLKFRANTSFGKASREASKFLKFRVSINFGKTGKLGHRPSMRPISASQNPLKSLQQQTNKPQFFHLRQLS